MSSKTKSINYKFRAECQVDVDRFLILHKPISITCSPDDMGFPDVEVNMVSNKTLSELQNIMYTIPDGHVMLESLNIADKYDGDRWFTFDNSKALDNMDKLDIKNIYLKSSCNKNLKFTIPKRFRPARK